MDMSAMSEAMPKLEDMQHWTWVMGRAQQMMMEHMAEMASKQPSKMAADALTQFWDPSYWQEQMANMPKFDPAQIFEMQSQFWQQGLNLWQGLLAGEVPKESNKPDRRFQADEWQSHPAFSTLVQGYTMIADHLLRLTDTVDGIDPKAKAQLRFAMQNIVDASAPSNFALTNPAVIKKTIETKGQNLLTGLEHMLRDIRNGQMTHTDPNAFELGRNIAVTPGKVVHETALYQLIQYSPTTDKVLKTPLIIFPPWINRFYILDLNEKKSFVKWAVDQGITLFMVSWKSADSSMREVIWDDYVRSQIDAIDTVRELLKVPDVHTIGYCVSGTTLAATLALMAERGQAEKVKSATFFTAQVDFAHSGDLKLFIDDQQLKLIDTVAADSGYLDGRYMAATFNMLRGRDLIWNYVVNNYLLGEDYPPFDLLHWNGDTTNLPVKWHKAYLADLYRDNKLVEPGAITIDGTPIDLRKITTPILVQAGKEDHIAPAKSAWKIMDHVSGPKEFMLAGSGHIAGVVNPPAAKKYQYWTNPDETGSLSAFIEGAEEHPGSWWPYWVQWLEKQAPAKTAAKGARIPGEGDKPAIEDAPGRYVRQ
ncbi:PHA/PHB synthase family protein [Alterisphingorhabdus coralli]|uniref:Class I poly(R)-hydroxyalkanoic acid synthase n=1 Tax=Alterisphingorhabdus coralli TaxID=3071408 RepID=A0AA97FBA1_9SPHN|nr:class I poly(R)-hydroxyalkanoic acid synthase [Parasphingorhabdus sp. SCSIO 66989]WOE76687.1 class I poly(R)-hydroxyalkanoic acid synthase [Parasphingorhabdus sp. SCSIO 66989]